MTVSLLPVFTLSREGYPANSICNLANLPGAFAVWAASKEASFLHGRYVWNSWDVEELANSETLARLKEDRDYLKIIVKGLKGARKD